MSYITINSEQVAMACRQYIRKAAAKRRARQLEAIEKEARELMVKLSWPFFYRRTLEEAEQVLMAGGGSLENDVRYNIAAYPGKYEEMALDLLTLCDHSATIQVSDKHSFILEMYNHELDI